jgi:hypothetical protein
VDAQGGVTVASRGHSHTMMNTDATALGETIKVGGGPGGGNRGEQATPLATSPGIGDSDAIPVTPLLSPWTRGNPRMVRLPVIFRSVVALALPALVPGGVAGEAPQVVQVEAGLPDSDPGRGPPVARAVRVETPPLVDGRLDEDVWSLAPALSNFIQRIPRDGAPASEPTEVRILFDDEALYVGVWLWDSNPSGIVQGEAIRDARLDDSDAIILVFDTYRDRQNGFVFGTNPSGIEYDGQVANEGAGGGFGAGRQQGGAGGGFNLNWDGSWNVATSRDQRGWYAEFRIPFATLRYGTAEDPVWGLNILRRNRRLNEESTWSPLPRQYNLWRVSAAGILEGLQPPIRRHATVTPYLLQSTGRNWQLGETSYLSSTDVGADAKIQVTQGLTLDLTLNTDFAQVEVDDQQVNLTRFSLFFPEKRPFFLENAGFFNVGTGGSELFFSRSIGISGGVPVPIEGGGRLSGRAGGFNVGLLHIRTGNEGDPPLVGGPASRDGDAFSVVRVARELPGRSRIGTLVGHRGATGAASGHEDWNRTYAVDGQVGLGDAVTLTSFLGRTETPGMEGSDHVFHLSGNLATRDWRGFVTYREMGADFNPEIGFVNRRNYRTASVFGMHYIRPETGPFLEIRPHASYNTFRNLESGFEQSAYLHLDVHLETPSGHYFSPAFDWNRDGLERPFPIAPGVVVAPGTYDAWSAAWRFNTNQSAPLSVDAGVDWGGFLSGTRRGGYAAMTYRQGASASFSLRMDHNRVALSEGDFDVTLGRLRAGYFFTPRLYVQSLIQYSDQVDTWSANLRLGWLNTAGTGLFIVYNDAQGFGTLDGPQSRSFIVKYTRRFSVWDG